MSSASDRQPAPAPPPLAEDSVPLGRSLACMAASLLLWTTQGLGMNFVAVNVYQIGGGLGATVNETAWLMAAYMAPNVSLTIILTKIRSEFGLRPFTEVAIGIFALAALLHLFVDDLNSGVAVRFLAGMAASPMSTLGFLYMLDAFPPSRKMTWGLSLALTCSAAMPTLARLVSPGLLDIGGLHTLYTAELGLALMSLACVFVLPLTPVPRAKVLHRLDFISYPLIAIGFGLLAIVLTLGRLYWWFEAPWLGWCLAGACLSIAGACAIELRRETPLMDLRWLLSRDMLHLAIVLLAFRILLAEQGTGAVNLFQTLGLLNEQSAGLYGLTLAVTVAGGLLCGAALTLERVPLLHGIALVCIASGAWMDAHATSLTRPADMYLSQALVAFGGALFLPPAMLAGLTRTMKQGPTYITSFLVVFLFTQSLGGQIASALFGTMVTLREKFHSSHLVERVTAADPMVMERIRQLGAAYGRVLTDPALLNAEGVAALSQQATREANVLAYNDVFLLIAILAATALATLLAQASWRLLRDRPGAPILARQTAS